jgi:peroxiredoxin
MAKKPIMMLVSVLAAGLILAGCATTSQGTGAGSQAPDFQLPDLDGNVVSLSGLRGSPVLLNFWASWCGPCREEMPYIQQIHEEWSGRGLVVLTVNLGENADDVREFMEEFDLTFPALLDTETSLAETYNVGGIPTTYFIDKEGIIRERKIGAFPSAEVIEQSLSKIMP